MKESIIKLIYIAFGLIFIIAVLNNQSNIGKYVPFGNKMILDTRNGNVYIPTKEKYTWGKYIWEKHFAFKPKKTLEAELDKTNKELKIVNSLLKTDKDKELKQKREELKLQLEVEAEEIQNKLKLMN